MEEERFKDEKRGIMRDIEHRNGEERDG